MSVGQWSNSVDCWLTLLLLLRMFSLLRAPEARCRSCAMAWAGTAEKGLRVVLGVGRGTSGWSNGGVAPCGGGSGNIGVGASAPACGLLFEGGVPF